MAWPNYGKPKKVSNPSGASRPTKGAQASSPRLNKQGSNSHSHKVAGYTKGDGTRVRSHFRRDSGIPNPNIALNKRKMRGW